VQGSHKKKIYNHKLHASNFKEEQYEFLSQRGMNFVLSNFFVAAQTMKSQTCANQGLVDNESSINRCTG
jgi:hypothetical protein